MARELGCEAYYHAADNKARILGRFKDTNQHQVIMTTSIFGIGVDIPNIRVIVHADRRRTLLDYAQESGRAGRDGVEDASPEVLESMEDAANIHDEEC